MSDDDLVKEICSYFDMCDMGCAALEQGDALVDELSIIERGLKRLLL